MTGRAQQMQAGQRGTLLLDQPRPGQGQSNPLWRGALCTSLAMEGGYFALLGVTMTMLFALLQATMEGQLQLSSLEPCRNC
jgi:hypothetical protein